MKLTYESASADADCIRSQQRLVATRAQFRQKVTTSPRSFKKAMAASVSFHGSGSFSLDVAQSGILVILT
jgi:hypothetical protein